MWAILLLLAASLMGPLASVEAANFATYPTEPLELSLEVELGGDANSDTDEPLDLSLSVTLYGVTASITEEPLDISLLVRTGPEFYTSVWPSEVLGLHLDLGRGLPFNIVWVWDPYDQPKLTGVNYTYLCYVGLQGIPQELDNIVIRFEGSIVTEKSSNSTGQFDFWAIVGISGIHTWSFTLFDEGEELAILWKDTEYAEPGPGPVDDPPPGPGPDIPDLPSAPGSLFGVFDFLPLMVVFGIFGFIGNLIVGRVGVLFGAVAALFLTTAMGTIPAWVLYFVILVTIIVVAYKLKTGGSNVTVNGGVSA